MILQRQVLQSCRNPLGGASDSVHRQSGRCTRWCASCASLCFAQRQVPTVLFLVSLSWVRNAVALWRLVKEFHIFSTCLRCLLGICTLFPRAPCSGSHLPLCVATVHGSFWTNFVYFLREKWTLSSPRSSHPRNLNIFSTSSIWQRTKPPVPASVYVASGRISHIFNVMVDSDFPAQFALENLDIIFTCSHMAVGGGFRRH